MLVGSSLVQRRKLLAGLDAHVDALLVVLSGDPGSGKTTVLDQFFQHVGDRADRRPVPFVVDDRDNDSRHLRQRLEAVVGLGNERLTLFVDNFDVIRSEEASRAIVNALDIGLGAVQMILAVRGRTDLPIADRHGSNTVAVFDDDDLRLTDAELDEIIAANDLSVAPAVRAQLLRTTEGWCHGVSVFLAELAGDDAPGVHERVEVVAENLGAAMVELVEPVVESEDFDFLMQTSVLPELSPELGREVAGVERVPDLRRLESSGAFIHRVDRNGHRFRLHPLLRRGLIARLREGGGRSFTQRHVRAGHYFGTAGEHLAAVEHFMTAGQPTSAADAIARMWSAARTAITEDHLAQCASPALVDYVPHVLTTGFVRGANGDIDAIRDALEHLTESSWSGPLPHGFPDLATGVAELRSMLPTNGQRESEGIVQTIVSWDDDVKTDQRRLGFYTAAHNSYFLDRPEGARELLQSVLVGHLTIGRHSRRDRIATVLAAELTGLLDYDEGRLDEARTQLAHADDLADHYEIGLLTLPGEQVRQLNRAVINRDDPKYSAEQLQHLMENGVTAALKAHAATELIRLLDQQRDYSAALVALTQAEEIAAGASLPNLPVTRLATLGRSLRQPRGPGPPVQVTWGERSVLQLLADKTLVQHEISEQLGLSINTVKSHLRSVYQKLGATTRSEAIQRASELDILSSVFPWRMPAAAGSLGSAWEDT